MFLERAQYMTPLKNVTTDSITRRELLRCATGLAVAGTCGLAAPRISTAASQQSDSQETSPLITNGRIKQSFAYWCFHVAGDKWDIQQQAQMAQQLGCGSVELVEPEDFPILRENGLICALTPNGMPGDPFAKGLNNPTYQE